MDNTAPAKLTQKMLTAILMAFRDGACAAGHQAVRGHLVKVQASTLKALERRGMMTIHTHPDGCIMGRLTPAGLRAMDSHEIV